MRAVVSAERSFPLDWVRVLWVLASLCVVVVLGYVCRAGITAVIRGWELPEYSHGWLIPPITLLLLWQRRAPILTTRGQGSWLGTWLFAGSIAVVLVSSAALMFIPQAMAFILAVIGLGIAAFGVLAMRLTLVPLVFLLASLPIPSSLYYLVSGELQLISSQIGAWMLYVFGATVFLDGNIIDLGTFKLQVAEACSGLRYLFPLSAFGFLCAWLYRAPLWARAVVFFVTIPITVLTNSARIALTGVLMEYGNRELAEGFLHLFEGWIIFLLALLLLLGLIWGLAHVWSRNVRPLDLLDFDRIAGGTVPVWGQAAARPFGPTAPLLVSLALLVAALPSQAWIANRTEQIVKRPGLVTFPQHLAGWEGRSSSVDAEMLEVLQAQDYLLADYTAPNGASSVNLWVAYYGSQTREGGIHPPKACLPGAGWEFARIEAIPSPAPDAAGTYFNLNRALVTKGQEQILIYYWYEQRGRRFTEEIWTKIYILIDAFTKNRSDGALVRILTPIRSDETLEAADHRLAEFFRVMYPALEPHVGA